MRLALLDVSTGEFRTTEFAGAQARQQAVDELPMAAPERGVDAGQHAETPAGLEKIRGADRAWKTGFGRAILPCRCWSGSWMCGRWRAIGLAGHPAAAIAAGAVLHYVRTTQKNESAAHRFAAVSTSTQRHWNWTR